MFRSANLTTNAYLDKYKYSGCGIGFNLCPEFPLPDDSMGKSAIIFGAHMSSSMHIDNKKKDIWFLGEGPTQGWDVTTLTAEA